MANIPISSLYLPGLKLFQTQAAAKAAGEIVSWDASKPPKYWRIAVDPSLDPTDPFTIHNLHDAAGTAVWSKSFITNEDAGLLNIPPDSTGPNPIVYPPSVSIPMVYPLPVGDSYLDTPFGLIVSDSSNPAPVDPTMGRAIAGINALLVKAGLPQV